MKALLYILPVLLLSLPCFGQKPVISVDFDEVEKGDPIILTVKSPIAGTLEISYPDEFVPGSSVQSGMKEEVDYNTGKTSRIYFYSQNGAFSKEGTYTLHATIIDKNKSYKSKAITIKVLKQVCVNSPISKRNLKQPVFGIVERSKAKVYEGEPIIVNGKIYSKLKVNVAGYHPFEVVGNPEVIPLNSSNDLIFGPETLKGQQFYSAQFGKQLMFFTSPGKYQVNPFEMAVMYEIEENYSETLAFTSNGTKIEIIPLPDNAPDDFIGAVGKYSLSRSFDKTTVVQGDVVTATVTISGHGNLHNINTPELRLPKGIVIYGDPSVEEKLSFGLRGAEGKIIYTYNLQVLKHGHLNLGEMSVSYFDPEQKRYITLREPGTEIISEESGTFHAQLPKAINKANPEKSGLEPVIAANSATKKDHFIHSALFWPTVVSPFALAFLGGLFFTRRKKFSEKATEKTQTKERMQAANHLLKDAAVKADAGEVKEGFSLLSQALKTAASVLMQSESTQLTKLEIQHGLQEMGYDSAKIDQFNRLFLQCEEARYAFMDQPELFQQTFEEARQLIQNL